jgi:hypothetical protein
VNSALLAPGGRLFAIVWPKTATHDPVGPTLQLAPIVAENGLYTVPLSTVRQIAVSA